MQLFQCFSGICRRKLSRISADHKNSYPSENESLKTFKCFLGFFYLSLTVFFFFFLSWPGAEWIRAHKFGPTVNYSPTRKYKKNSYFSKCLLRKNSFF